MANSPERSFGLPVNSLYANNRRMSKLRAYLIETKTRQSDLAKKVGVSFGYMSELVAGGKTPGLELAVRIEDATGGAVRARDWITPPDAAPEQDVA